MRLFCAPGPRDPKEAARIGISRNQDKSWPGEAFLSRHKASLSVSCLRITVSATVRMRLRLQTLFPVRALRARLCDGFPRSAGLKARILLAPRTQPYFASCGVLALESSRRSLTTQRVVPGPPWRHLGARWKCKVSGPTPDFNKPQLTHVQV